MREDLEKVGDFWDRKNKEYQQNRNLRLRWWQSPQIIEHINYLVCGHKVKGVSQGLIRTLKSSYGQHLPLSKGVSIGCGNGLKEMTLVREGLVKQFDLFELSADRVAQGEELAKKFGIEGSIKFFRKDAFKVIVDEECYDLVHWNNALHHMFDVEEAVRWSRNVLKVGGIFYMDDFVGASRFQWPDFQLEIASQVRSIFIDTPYLVDPRDPSKLLTNEVKRPNPELLARDDPSEAVESDKILPAIRKFFPNAYIKQTGGVIYHLTLNDMLANFQDDKADQVVLQLLLKIDELCAKLGETQYAVALAQKSKS